MTAVADVADRSIAELISLAGRSAVVTGGGRGLGKAIARRLAQAGGRGVAGAGSTPAPESGSPPGMMHHLLSVR